MSEVNGGIEFDWDATNTRHLKRHRVTTHEFEELMSGDPVYLEYQARNDEERYKVLGVTKAGRVLIGVWMQREGRSGPLPRTPRAALTGTFIGRPTDETETRDTRL